ncbi:MAG: bifunctional UDP-N-acetylmuramoyl-L-alanyl-D-glutamate--2,6-diaminopimelate ligase MurE/UDP-N-acetylmuramoyl-tripeptide--D-alanyl-D-alanine ligase MurF [Betaproteobacteria bacterium]|nr:bifunctional UDP-N-acetylmuramoyl-L-alanyl-D-glutamate--2,6-diaminopimelate ligase MurE/UDP-N-acetylmuramoyl-tripeptide--D-alanyl-D-alanine ligase MurF [Betaproteobacteria bacterium]
MLRVQTPAEALAWLQARVTGTLVSDSRAVRAGDGFIAWPGAAADARHHVADAVQRGATACLVDAQGVEAWDFGHAPVVAMDSLQSHLGGLAVGFFGSSSAQLPVFAVTGTNGKTSSAWWLAQALAATAHTPGAARAGFIGTLGCGLIGHGAGADASALRATGLTTPDPVTLHAALHAFAQQGAPGCAIEASSIGLQEHRLDGLAIRCAIFTNFSQDHLDYHGSMDAYWAAKRALFNWPGLRSAVVCTDSAHGARLAEELGNSGLDVWTCSTEHPARLQACAIRSTGTGMAFEVDESGVRHTVQSAVPGHYNVANLLGVIAALRSHGIPLAQAAAACSALQAPPGRMEPVAVAGVNPLVLVDYAHTPDGLSQALAALRPLALARGGQLWCAVGCGGDRDPGKRPLMGVAAVQGADRVVFTSDNPRSEDPAAILAQTVAPLQTGPNWQLQADRALAIADAVLQAHDRDVVLIAGKGHETSQEIAGQRLSFDDRVHARTALEARAATRMTLGHLASLIPHGQFSANPASPWLRVHTDSRSTRAGDVFVALRGEKFDANAFLPQAIAQGAVAVVCHPQDPATEAGALPRIEVPDTQAALSALGQAWRAQWHLPLIAVTGSNGKTTVTQMLAAILNAHAPDGAALATQGNLNNHIGVPLTVLRLRSEHRIGVVELGMNHPGEIAQLSAVAQPTVALVNNAQREHLEFMHTVDAVAAENGAVISALPAAGVAVFPGDDAYTALWRGLAAGRRAITFSDTHRAAAPDAECVQLVDAQWQSGHWRVRAQADLAGQCDGLQFDLHIAGRHNVRNALAAAACALAAGVSASTVAAGLSAFLPVQGRSRAVGLAYAGRSITLVDDSYNANPDSVRAAIDVLADLPGPRLLVLGDMGEVGDQGPAFHAEAGAYAAAKEIESIVLTGNLSRHAQAAAPAAQHIEAMADVCAAAVAQLPQIASVLVKGSRFMRMEQVVAALTQACATQAAEPVSQGEAACC